MNANPIPVRPDVEKRALEIWREREMQFPERVRRMKPDQLDYASGAWLRCLIDAAKEFSQTRAEEQHVLL